MMSWYAPGKTGAAFFGRIGTLGLQVFCGRERPTWRGCVPLLRLIENLSAMVNAFQLGYFRV
jgi:hypothetical protein